MLQFLFLLFIFSLLFPFFSFSSHIFLKFLSTPAWTYIAVDVTILIAPFLRNPLTAEEMNLLRFYPAFDDVRQKLQSNTFKVNDVARLLMRIRNVVHTTTRHRLPVASGLVLDGPMQG